MRLNKVIFLDCLRATLVGTGVGLIFGLLGTWLLVNFSYKHQSGFIMGSSLFIALPFLTGLSVGVTVRTPILILTSLTVTVTLTFAALLISRMEGLLCCLMALPLVLPGIGAGAFVGYNLKKRWLSREKTGHTKKLMVILFSLVILSGSSYVEKPLYNHPREVMVKSEYLLATSPEIVWDHLKEKEEVRGPKPLLMKLGLPVPEKCTLEASDIGAKRICYFNKGQIVEQVTKWDPPYEMGLKIVKVALPGNKWLGFDSAKYELFDQGGQTLLKRQTVITSSLYPAWYWKPLEILGVKTEHDYIISDLKRRLEN